MRRSLPWLLTIVFLAGCARLDAIPYAPPQTAATWLTIQPYAAIRVGALEIILVQPSTTLFVYLLGVVAIGAGLYFFRMRQGQKSRLWWGIAVGIVGRARAAGRDQLRGVQLCDQVRKAAGLRLDERVGGAVPHPLGGERGRHAGGRSVCLHDRQAAAVVDHLHRGEPCGLRPYRAGGW